jgi:hypothetical protein
MSCHCHPKKNTERAAINEAMGLCAQPLKDPNFMRKIDVGSPKHIFINPITSRSSSETYNSEEKCLEDQNRRYAA